MILTINDFRKVGMCVSGIKDFCKKHDINMRSFVRNGIDEKELININDAMLKTAIKKIKAKHGK